MPPDFIRQKILGVLNRVRRRNRTQGIVDVASWGMLLATVAALPFLVAQPFGRPLEIRPVFFLATQIGLGLLCGGVVGAMLPHGRIDAARRIDRFYGFKDRFLTATCLLNRPETTDMERLQLEDTAEHVRRVDPKVVASYRRPKTLPGNLLLLVMAFLLLVAPPISRSRSSATPPSNPEIAAVVENLREELVAAVEKLRDRNREDKVLEVLSSRLREWTEKLQGGAVESREALAALSEMENELRDAITGLQLESVDLSMKELGQALETAAATRTAGQSLESGQYDLAADDLEKAEWTSLTDEERKTLAEQLQTTAESMKKRNQPSLASASQQLSVELESFDMQPEGGTGNGELSSQDQAGGGERGGGAGKLAEESRKQALRKELGRELQGKLALLELAKADIAGSGLQHESDKQSVGGSDGQVVKSEKPSQTWGEGAAGRPDTGQETSLDGTFEKKELTGKLGEGESEIQTFRSTEVQNVQSKQEFQDVFHEYRKAAEAVLESEAIPLGQRQAVRRYFKSIGKTD